MANAVQNGIIGNDSSVTGAVIGASVLFALNNFLARAQYRFPVLSRVFEGKPAELITSGKPNIDTLRHEQISLPDCGRSRAARGSWIWAMLGRRSSRRTEW